MHICPQEIMAAATAIGALKYIGPMIKHWCQSCVDGTHKSCEDHTADQVEMNEEIV